jgi:LmbE family N-acetylglucosaminyl deacetylase
MNKILIVAAHPDDDILGCGGLMAKYSKQKKIRVIFIAEGSSCRFSNLDAGQEVVRNTIIERNSFAVSALKSLGVTDVKFYDLPCGRLDTIPIIDINKIIENEVRSFNPNILMTHSEYDTNNDHRIVNRSVMMATRPGVFDTLKKVISFEIQSSSEWNFNDAFLPNVFEELKGSDLEKKWDALSCYKSEIQSYPHPRSYKGMQTLARYRGMQIGYNLAEAYRIIWSIGV